MLLIIDNQSSFIKKFKRNYLAEEDFEYQFVDHNQPIIIPKNKKVTGIILSGGKGTPYEPLNLTSNFVALMNFNVPVLGFCLGHEIIAAAYGGRIKRCPEPQSKKQKIIITMPDDALFEGLASNEVWLIEKHHHYVSQLPGDFISLGHSDKCENEIIRHNKKPIYSFQSHPEVSGHDGLLMVKNFLKICKLI